MDVGFEHVDVMGFAILVQDIAGFKMPFAVLANTRRRNIELTGVPADQKGASVTIVRG